MLAATVVPEALCSNLASAPDVMTSFDRELTLNAIPVVRASAEIVDTPRPEPPAPDVVAESATISRTEPVVTIVPVEVKLTRLPEVVPLEVNATMSLVVAELLVTARELALSASVIVREPSLITASPRVIVNTSPATPVIVVAPFSPILNTSSVESVS